MRIIRNRTVENYSIDFLLGKYTACIEYGIFGEGSQI